MQKGLYYDGGNLMILQKYRDSHDFIDYVHSIIDIVIDLQENKIMQSL